MKNGEKIGINLAHNAVFKCCAVSVNSTTELPYHVPMLMSAFFIRMVPPELTISSGW